MFDFIIYVIMKMFQICELEVYMIYFIFCIEICIYVYFDDIFNIVIYIYFNEWEVRGGGQGLGQIVVWVDKFRYIIKYIVLFLV